MFSQKTKDAIKGFSIMLAFLLYGALTVYALYSPSHESDYYPSDSSASTHFVGS